MTQTTYNRQSPMGFVGTTYNSREYKSDPKLSNEIIEFGRKLMYGDADKETVGMIGVNKVVLTNSANLDASDTYSFTLKITNTETGVETTNNLTTTFATSDAVTMGVIVTALEALTGINDALTAYASNALNIVADAGYVIEVSSEVTGGGSAVTIAKANSDTRLSAGFSVNPLNREMVEVNGEYVTRYTNDDIVDMLNEGELIVESPTGFNGTDTLYYVGYGVNRGKIVNAVATNTILATDIKHYITAPSTNSKGVVTVKA